MKPQLSVSFSGGRTSAYMAKWLLDNKSDKYELSFIFCNTGLEHEKTLDFVNECDKRWGLDLVWLETVANPVFGKGSDYRIMSYETASRDAQPFEDVCKVYGLSNRDFQPCNRELKTVPMSKYRSDFFRKDCLVAVGIRSDEIDRIRPDYKKKKLCYPLAFWHPTTKEQIRHWWAKQDFDLEIPEHMGNCVTCWKKSDRKLMTIAKHEPERFAFMRRMEEEHGFSGAPTFDEKGNQVPRYWFRGYKTCDDIIASSKRPFREFVDHMPELQLSIFDELDASNGCEESCEAF
jgi:hypothetical protein